MSETSARHRPTDVPLPLLFALFLFWFPVFLVLARLVHGFGHAFGAWAAGGDPIGTYLPLFGPDTGLVNYPEATWSSSRDSLPFFLGGGGAALVLAVGIAYLWPPSFSIPKRLLPFQFAAVLAVHGLVEPFTHLSSRSEAGLAADLLGIAPVALMMSAALAALALAVHLSLRAVTLASVVAAVRTPARRLAFVLAFWTVPELVYRAAGWWFGIRDPWDLVAGAVLAVAPALAAWGLPPRIFHQRVDSEGTGFAVVIGALLTPVLLAGWWWLFLGFAPPQTLGIRWGAAGMFNNIRPDTPVRSLSSVLKGDRSAEPEKAPPIGIYPSKRKKG